MDEFDLIATYFKPLAKDFSGSLGLSDDAAILSIPAGLELVVTKDAISEDVHFIGDEDPGLIAQKLLRVNLSDLAAMGATPLAYFLALMLPKTTKSDWVKRFTEGLAADQKQFGIHLAGGDTTATQGKLSLSVTALGTVPKGQAIKRSGAKPGDGIYVSGTLGDSALGLSSLRGASATKQSNRPGLLRSARNDKEDFLINRYLLPEPRIALGQQLLGIAHAAIDISDGLVQDLGHICKTSLVGAVIERDKLPLSSATNALLKKDETLWEKILGGGDDYELLFTAPSDKKPLIEALAKDLKLPLTAIGTITEGSGVRVLDASGNTLDIARAGFKHF